MKINYNDYIEVLTEKECALKLVNSFDTTFEKAKVKALNFIDHLILNKRDVEYNITVKKEIIKLRRTLLN